MYVVTCLLTLENREPINCMVARVLGGSLASIPSKALDSDTMRRLTNSSSASRSADLTAEADKDVRNNGRPTNATDITAVFNWWVAVIWTNRKDK